MNRDNKFGQTLKQRLKTLFQAEITPQKRQFHWCLLSLAIDSICAVKDIHEHSKLPKLTGKCGILNST